MPDLTLVKSTVSGNLSVSSSKGTERLEHHQQWHAKRTPALLTEDRNAAGFEAWLARRGRFIGLHSALDLSVNDVGALLAECKDLAFACRVLKQEVADSDRKKKKHSCSHAASL